MSFHIKFKKNIQKEVQKVITTALKKSIKDIDNTQLDLDIKIHNIRKSFKKIRAVLRIIKFDLKDKRLYRKENEFYKLAGQQFSATRDATVLLETLEKLQKKYSLATQEYEKEQKKVIDESAAVSEDETVRELILLKEALLGKLKEVHQYKLKKSGSHSLEKGIQNGYKKGKKLFQVAVTTEDGTDYHQLRKWVKYHLYQMQLIEKNYACLMKKRVKKLKILADVLGFEHDLTVLKEFVSNKELSPNLIKAIDEEQQVQRAVVKKLIPALYCFKKSRFILFLKSIRA